MRVVCALTAPGFPPHPTLAQGKLHALSSLLQAQEAIAIARGYSMNDLFPLRINRVRVAMAAGC